jgi:hypothetical protein
MLKNYCAFVAFRSMIIKKKYKWEVIMRSISYKKQLMVGLLFCTALTTEAASTAFGSMGTTIEAMRRDGESQNLSSNYSSKLASNLDSLESSAKEGARLSKGVKGRPTKGWISEGDMRLLDVAIAAADSEGLDQLPKESRQNLLDEIKKILRQLPRSEKSLISDTEFAIDSLEQSLDMDDDTRKTHRKPRKKRSRETRDRWS